MTTAEEYRAKAAECEERKHESFERCDTDGFATQWAHGLMAQESRMKADLADDGGRHNFPAVFDKNTGELLTYTRVKSPYGYPWIIRHDDGSATFINESSSAKKQTCINYMHKRGYTIGTINVPAVVKLSGGSGRGMSGAMNVMPYIAKADNINPDDIVIVSTDDEYWY